MEFESSVISYGSKTRLKRLRNQQGFESSVISYGSKTVHRPALSAYQV